MNTKQALLENLRITPPMDEMIGKVNFQHLEKFVTDRLSFFVGNRGIDAVRYDINYDVQTPTDDFIVNLIEVGSVQILKENGLMQDEQFIDALYVIIAAMSIVVAEFLRREGIANVSCYRYIDADPQYVLLERAVEHVDATSRNNSYLINLLNTPNTAPVNGHVVC